MKIISGNTIHSYDIIIGNKIINNIGSHISQRINPGKAILVSDPIVWSFYGSSVAGSLSTYGFNVIDYIIPAGEQGKSGEYYLKLLNYLAESHVGNGDLLIALGGGSVCDLCGFAAATYSKKLVYIQVPTTISSMINTSMSCKASINLAAGRNLGSIHITPLLILCDTSSLDSILPSSLSDSCAEILKYAILFDADLFNHIKERKANFDREYVISRCVEIRQNLSFKGGEKSIYLQLGHTVADAIESIENYAISHGKALSLGIAAACRASEKLGFCTNHTATMVTKTMQALTLSIGSTYSAEDIYDAARTTKVFTDSHCTLLLLKEIGECFIYTTDKEGLHSFIEYGL